MNENQGGLSGLGPLRSHGSLVVMRGRLDCVISGQKTLKESTKLKGDYQAQVHSGQMVLLVVRQGGCTA